MTKKKQYKNRLPTVLPPAPRPAPTLESLAPQNATPDRPSEHAAAPQPPVVRPSPPAAPPPAPSPRSAEERRRRTLLALFAAGFAAGVVGFLVVAIVPRLFGSGPREPDAEPALPPTPPAAAAADESYVETMVLPDGSQAVRQWIQTERPLRRLSVALPDVPDGLALVADRVRVVAGGQAIPGPSRISSQRTTYRFAATTSLQLSYRLLGAVQVSGSPPGRALALATALDVRWPSRPEQETRVIGGAEVLSLACASSAEASPVPCGTVDRDQWQVDLTGPRVTDRVIAQVDLG